MTERGDDVAVTLDALDGLAVRDHWLEILDRSDDRVRVVELRSHQVRHRPRLWQVAAAAVAAVALVGAGLALGRATSKPQKVRTAAEPAPALAWTVGTATPVAGPDVAAQPLMSGSGDTVYAAFQGGNQIVAVHDGVAKTRAINAQISAVAAGSGPSGQSFAVVLTRAGAVLRLDASGRERELASLGDMSPTRPSIAIASGTVFVAGNNKTGLLALDADRAGAPRTVRHVTATVVAGDGDVMWALDQSTGRLERIAARTLQVTATTRVSDVIAMSASSNGLYLARSGGLLTRVDAQLGHHDLTQIDPSTTSVSAGRNQVWVSSLGAVTAYAPDDGRVIGVIARPTRSEVGVSFDGKTTWVLSSLGGLRSLNRVP